MKKIRKLTALVLAAVLLLALTGCELGSDKVEALAGRWELTMRDSQEQAEELMEQVDFYPEEMEICKDIPLTSVKVVEFDTEKNYAYSFDPVQTRRCVRDFYSACFEMLYANREKLNEAYEADLTGLTQEEFYLMYAQMYEQTDLDALLDLFADGAYVYEDMERYEVGTFRLLGDQILCTEEGSDREESMSYKLTGDELELEYSDGSETYHRAK